MGHKVRLSKIIPLYRYLLMEEARLRLSHGFRPFVGMLRILDGRAFLDVQEVDTGSTDDEKDEFVEQVRRDAQANGAVAVWCGAQGFVAPDSGPRPSRHPERRRLIMLFESSVMGDRLWRAFVRAQPHDERDDVGRWDDEGTLGNGRFVNLLGGGPRLVRRRR